MNFWANPIIPVFLHLGGNPFYGYGTVCFPISIWQVWIVSSVWLLWVKLVWMSVTSLGLMYGYFHGESRISGSCNIYLILYETAGLFFKVVVPFSLLTSDISCCTSLPIVLGIVNFPNFSSYIVYHISSCGFICISLMTSDKLPTSAGS